MLSSIAPQIDRRALVQRYRANRSRSAMLFATVAPEAFEDRPIPLRHPFAFYEGHFPAFSYLVLCRRALGMPPIDADLESLFERGIDPGSLADATRHARSAWPDRGRVAQVATRWDDAVERALLDAPLDGSPLLERGQALFAILEHEEMHHETLLYIIHRLDRAKQRPGTLVSVASEGRTATHERVRIPAGTATLGADPADLDFGWDNEFAEHPVAVDAFDVDVDNVTNADYLAFVDDGGPVPPFWLRRSGRWYVQAMWDDLPLPPQWPVYVTNEAARAYAAWRGGRLMTESEYHRAAFGTPGGSERAYPWGDDAPAARHGNFGLRYYDPQPVGSFPSGTSAWGVRDLIGNGWEWTSTPFEPHPGFAPTASYPQYSADFFDGRHFVLKGASPATDPHLIRRSFRNWFYADYPYTYATFRCAYDGAGSLEAKNPV